MQNMSHEELLSLLDDPSPTVRRALLARFTALGADAAPFLHEIARGAHPALARAAKLVLMPGHLLLYHPILTCKRE